MKKIVVSTFVGNKQDLNDTLLMAESVKRFSINEDILILVYYASCLQVDKHLEQVFENLNIQAESLKLDQKILDFPYAAKVFASSSAEKIALANDMDLIWIDPDNIFLKSLKLIKIPESKKIGLRPVYLLNIGSKINEEPNDFWKFIYRDCRTDISKIFPVETIVDKKIVRNYFNVGFMYIKPKYGILNKWASNFRKVLYNENYTRFYSDNLYKVFVHQAVFSATLSELYDKNDIEIFDKSFSFSLYFHGKNPNTTNEFSEVFNLRHEWFWNIHNWEKILPFSPEINTWIIDKRKLWS
ncbi:MAG: hypothetical protein JXR48_13420 [Candidatus Delongbacteria bacterium]|nr:hypothetical protein [Candidatus Delongbacteria bacterium]MBN2835955.1 hypothetical protein [Candidatus Delongbacteria bacterium]